MVEGKEFAEWSRAAAIITKMHNLQCVKRSDMRQPADFHPYLAGKRKLIIPQTKDGIASFANMAKKAFGCKDN
jgi:hypothetical protein